MEIPTSFVEKARFVGVIFTDVEKEYDALLRLLTLGMDWAWRRRMMSKIRFARGIRILDLACGTGLVTYALARLIGSEGLVIGLDPSMSMMSSAIRKKHSTRESSWIEFIRATGEFMPFRDGIFQYETIGLGPSQLRRQIRHVHRSSQNTQEFRVVSLCRFCSPRQIAHSEAVRVSHFQHTPCHRPTCLE